MVHIKKTHKLFKIYKKWNHVYEIYLLCFGSVRQCNTAAAKSAVLCLTCVERLNAS